MPTAPSFQSYKQVSTEPFMKNGKLYVTVEHPNTKNHRDVRWYSDAEFIKTYGVKPATNSGFSGLKQARGFDKGPILVIRNNRPADEEWLRNSIARYALDIGWYIVSTDSFPDDAPDHFKYLLLSWDEFKEDNCHAKKPAEIASILDKKRKNREWVNIK